MRRRKVGLDYLRAAAILCVLVAHTCGSRPIEAVGFVGVEVFFVLSGYLIGGILLDAFDAHGGTITWPLVRRFWVRRWLRTMPAYFLFLPVYALTEPDLLPVRRLPLYATFTQNLAWPMGLFFGVSWSLTIEEWFYLLLPLLTLAGAWAAGRLRPALAAVVVGMFVVPVLLRLTLGPGHPFDDGVRKVVVFRLDTMMWGVGLAALERHRPATFHHLARPVYAALGVAALTPLSLWVWVHFRQDFHFPATFTGMAVLTAVSPAAALLVPFCASLPSTRSTLNRYATLISAWSYAIYLCHVPVIRMLGRFFGDERLATPAVVVIAWVVVFGVAAAVHYGFERPVLRWRDRLTAARPVPA